MDSIDCNGAVLSIDLSALAENYRIIRRQVTPAHVAGVVKANAYGLGVGPVVRTLLDEGCRYFFVAQLCEARELSALLPPISKLFILNGLQPGTEPECASIGAIPVLNSLDQIQRWSALAQRTDTALPAALQFDSGMARFGIPPEDVPILVTQPGRLNNLRIELLMSHLASADDPVDIFNTQQFDNFMSMACHFPGSPRSIDNSGGSFHNRKHLDIVRAGIVLYGGAPGKGHNPMRPVVSLETAIAQLRKVPAGYGVGYGLSHVCTRDTHIATIPVGYADGLPRQLGNRGSAFFGGYRVKIVGRVSMDSITLDVSDVPDELLYPGARVELLGPHQTVDDIANDAGTISYEILTQMGSRYLRKYLLAHAHDPEPMSWG